MPHYAFSICGKRPVLEALSAGKPYAFKCLCIAYGREKDEEVRQILMLANRRSIPLQKSDPRELDRYAPGFFNHQGLVLLLKEPPRAADIDGVLEYAGQASTFSILALDCLSDHANIGAIIRSAAAFGVQTVLTVEDRAAPLIHPTIWRTSQGAAEHVQMALVTNLSQSLEELQKNGFWVVGATTRSQSQDVRQVKDWPKKLCLVLGSEEKGLRRLTQEHCDILVRIPILNRGQVDSLNIAQATSILLWEIFKGSLKNK